MKRKYTIEEIKEAIKEAQLKVIDKFDKDLEKSNKINASTRMAVQMQNMLSIVVFENELIKELGGK